MPDIQSRTLLGAEMQFIKHAALPRIQSRPVRAVLKWQLLVTLVLALAAGLLLGVEAAISAGLGGAVSICAGIASAMVMQISRKSSPGEALIAALRAEGVKVGLVIVLLWLVLTQYHGVVVPAFIGSFIASVVVFSMAFLVRDE